MAGGLAAISELNQFKDKPSSGRSPVGGRCGWKQSPLRYLPEAIRQSCLNGWSDSSRDEQELRVGSPTAGGKSRVRFEDEGTFFVTSLLFYYLFVFSALL